MKKYSIYTAALTLAAIVSCQKESSDYQQITTTPDIELESMTLSTGDSQSKTSVSGTAIVWSEDDKIDVFSNVDGYSNAYSLSATKVSGNAAEFSGEVAAGTTDFYAVYPSGLASKAAEGLIEITVPTDQTPTKDSFGEEMNVSVAKGTKTLGNPQVSGVAFHNVCSYLKFTVPSYVPDVKKVEVTCDREIAGSATVNYSALESGSGTVTGTGSVKTITMNGSFAPGSTFWFVLTPGTVKSLTINLTTAEGSSWTRTSTKEFTLNIGTPKNLGTIDFFPALASASAVHTKDGETLTGTEVNVNLGLLPSMMSSISAVNLQVTNGLGTTVRTYASGTPTTNYITIPADSSWPYLPQGDYTITGTYTISGTAKNFTQTSFTSPAPTFGVEALGTTSYSYYLAGNSTQANACDAETIYSLGGTAKISDAILNNANYSSLKGSYSYTLDNAATDAGDKTGQSWAAHTITATYTFDGVTVTSPELTCHVTGLPYTAAPPTNSGDHPWKEKSSLSSFKWENTYVRLYGEGSAPYITSPSFIIPEGEIHISINTDIKLHAYKPLTSLGLWQYTTFTATINSQAVITQTTPTKTEDITYSNLVGEGTFTTSNNNIRMNSSYTTSATDSYPYVDIYNVVINYR